RPDDSAAVVQERLRVYNAQTKPLISHYTDKGVLVTIDGESSPETVYQHLIKVYRSKNEI
nr:adenylate kinase [Parachlamydiaceae bacterium]